MKKRAHIFIRGKVQGVFFRSETLLKARKQNVNGWVRNLTNGEVEAILEGEEEDVKKLIAFCKRGSPGATVTGIRVAWEDYAGEFTDFEIRP